jgi:translation initiation factor 3 subunit H
MAEALAASIPAPQAPVAAPVVTAAESIPASMAKLVDIDAEIPVRTVQLDGLVSKLGFCSSLSGAVLMYVIYRL